jgi:YesN/AraC family two-component response regulator
MTFDEVYAFTQDLSILYVEDEEEVRKSITRLLENYYGAINVAKDGREGLKYYNDALKIKPYDIVLSDINMPHLNGLEMLKEIIALKDDQTVILFSAHHEKNYLLEARKMGVDYFIYKPINLDELSKVLYDSAKHTHSPSKS